MALIIVAGQTKDAGKTTLICNILRSFPAVKWTAVKISNHRHATENCEILKEGSGWRILQQNPTAEQNDTSRFLKAGAARALLVEAEENCLEEACSSLIQELSTHSVIVESSSAARFLPHELLLLLLGVARNEVKESAREQFEHADALLVREPRDQQFQSLLNKPVVRAFRDALDPALFRMLATELKSSI